MESGSEQLWYIWFAILIAGVVLLFVSKMKFNEMYQKREDRRKMFSYTTRKLDSSDEGLERSIKVKRVKNAPE